MTSVTGSALSFADVINILSASGIGVILLLVWRLFGTVKQYYEIREEAIQKRVEIETSALTSRISVHEDMLSQREQQISQLRVIIEANQFKNNVIINDFIEIGISRLDPGQKKELFRIVTEQE